MPLMGSNSPDYVSEWSEFILASLYADGSLMAGAKWSPWIAVSQSQDGVSFSYLPCSTENYVHFHYFYIEERQKTNKKKHLLGN